MKRILFVLVALLAGLETSVAAAFLFTVDNKSRSDIAKFHVRGGEIEGSTQVPANTKREVKVTLPDGKCRAEIHFDFASPNYLDDDKVLDFCKYGGLTIG